MMDQARPVSMLWNTEPQHLPIIPGTLSPLCIHFSQCARGLGLGPAWPIKLYLYSLYKEKITKHKSI